MKKKIAILMLVFVMICCVCALCACDDKENENIPTFVIRNKCDGFRQCESVRSNIVCDVLYLAHNGYGATQSSIRSLDELQEYMTVSKSGLMPMWENLDPEWNTRKEVNKFFKDYDESFFENKQIVVAECINIAGCYPCIEYVMYQDGVINIVYANYTPDDHSACYQKEMSWDICIAVDGSLEVCKVVTFDLDLLA